jgi:uncharacterized protein DUF3352
MKPLTRLLPGTLSALVLAFAAPAQQSLPAASMPADTLEYFELDAQALDLGLHQLDLVLLLEDPNFKEFFLPIFEQIGADPERPIDSLLERVPVRDFLAGNAALGVRGFKIKVEHPDGKVTEVEFSATSPINARGLLDLAGMVASASLDDEMGMMWNPQELNYEIGLDVVLVLEPGPALKAHVQQMLGAPQGPISNIETAQIAGREVTHISLDLEMTKGIVTDLYADLSGDRWLIATNLDTFTASATMKPAASLAAAPQFKKVYDRMTSGDPVLFGYSNAAMQMSVLKSFIPPIFGEAAGILGLDSYQGSGIALSMTEGGVRESFGLVFDGEPHGVFGLLDAIPGGIDMTTKAPPEAMAMMAFKFDPAILFERLTGLMDTMLPGTGERMSMMAHGGFAQTGFDLQDDFLGVIGDEVSVVVFPPSGMMAPPDWVLSVDVKDEVAARKLIAQLQEMAVAMGAPLTFQPVELEGLTGTQRIQIQGVPFLPSMVVANGHLLIASQNRLLSNAATDWGTAGADTMASSAVYTRTMNGLASGNTGNIAALAYVDLRQIAPPVLMMGMGMMPSEVVNTAAAPEVNQFADHLGGIAFAVRNDGDGLTLDAFSPVGVIIPAMVGAVAAQRSVVYSNQAEMGGLMAMSSPANDMNTQAWNMVRYADGDPNLYEAGLALSVEATEMEPENHWFLNTRGVAEYRTGNYKLALVTFTLCQEMNLNSSNQYDAASDVLFLAMTNWQLENKDTARELLKQADDMVGPGSDEEINTFFSEAHDLIDG